MKYEIIGESLEEQCCICGKEQMCMNVKMVNTFNGNMEQRWYCGCKEAGFTTEEADKILGIPSQREIPTYEEAIDELNNGTQTALGNLMIHYQPSRAIEADKFREYLAMLIRDVEQATADRLLTEAKEAGFMTISEARHMFEDKP